ncbi:MAG TPA: helix-turn-helix domain-containing protein [Vineibacter sp.]|nr:helix-turn-helix domain-containing protein [Vineibacter sp.]
MRSAPRRRLDPQIRRQELIETAERLLKAGGPDVRVEDVVREAGAAKGTFYLYFPTWDDLLEVLRERVVTAFDEAHPVPDAGDPGADWLRLFDRLAVAFVDAVMAMGGLHAALFHSDFAHRRPVTPADHPVNRLTAVIQAAQKAGAFAKVDPAATGRLLFAVIHETADAVAAGEDRKQALAAMRWVLRRTLARELA